MLCCILLFVLSESWALWPFSKKSLRSTSTSTTTTSGDQYDNVWWSTSASDTQQKLEELRQTNGNITLEQSLDRNLVVKQIIHRLKLHDASLLDFGGLSVRKFHGITNSKCLNLKRCTGTTCGFADSTKCSLYDGRNIPNIGTFDVIIAESVLHHSSENTIFLLQQLKKMCNKYMIVGEDVGSLYSSHKWQEILFRHDPTATFRGNFEWVTLFRLIGFELVHTSVLKRCNVEAKLKKIVPFDAKPCMLVYLLKC